MAYGSLVALRSVPARRHPTSLAPPSGRYRPIAGGCCVSEMRPTRCLRSGDRDQSGYSGCRGGTANILAGPLGDGAITVDHLAAVQRRRALATRLTQRFQVIIQNQLVARVLLWLGRRAKGLLHRRRSASTSLRICYGLRGRHFTWSTARVPGESRGRSVSALTTPNRPT
jgi:hypothetical protein